MLKPMLLNQKLKSTFLKELFLVERLHFQEVTAEVKTSLNLFLFQKGNNYVDEESKICKDFLFYNFELNLMQ